MTRDYPRKWLEPRISTGRFLALTVAFTVLGVVLLLMVANSLGEAAQPEPFTPVTAGPAVEYQP